MMTLFILTCILATTGAWTRLGTMDGDDNRFIRHHLALIDGLKEQNQTIANCWICTHAPVTSTSIPFLAVPVSWEEINFWVNCSDTWANNATQRLWNTTVGIPVVGWTEFPWWQGNLTGQIIPRLYLAFKGGEWVPRNKTKITDFGKIPQQGLKVSFKPTSGSSDAFKPSLLERYLHTSYWVNNVYFKNGTSDTCAKIPGNLQCNESSSYQNGAPTCGNPAAGYCSPLGQQPGWCMMSNVSKFVDLVHRLILQHSALWNLPASMYWVCGDKALKWLPVGVTGTCTLARLTPATYIVTPDQLDPLSIPKHTLHKRSADNKERPSGRPHIVQMGGVNKFFSALFIYPMLTQTWDKLVEATDYLDDQIWDILEVVNGSLAVQNQLIIVMNQHTLVLDYLTAAQGGMCQIIGPACCHYIDNSSVLTLKHKLEDVVKLRRLYDEANLKNQDSWWANTFSFLNPANWFKGIGGWLAGIVQAILQVLLMCLAVYLVFKLFLMCIQRCTKRKHRNSY
ncbi:syncytin-2-like [Phyllobates terribilis]|uniref:syncytin-2-like n=1 Tax=Phyllobates terribilis TaxID=111132 RepID=UPI003CCAB998